ncbi:unnamed protein product [Symbiodinium sp. CCMP2592]|nr:unnamed protein product [Symbiodinium sp. CCMP2592]
MLASEERLILEPALPHCELSSETGSDVYALSSAEPSSWAVSGPSLLVLSGWLLQLHGRFGRLLQFPGKLLQLTLVGPSPLLHHFDAGICTTQLGALRYQLSLQISMLPRPDEWPNFDKPRSGGGWRNRSLKLQ